MGSHQEADTKAIQKRDGGYVFTPRAFNIVWGNDSKHWRILVHTWEGPAEMISIMWFQLSGSLPVIPGKKYSITFKLGFNQGSYGWDAHPIFLMAKIGKGGQYSWKRLKELEGMPGGPIDVPDDSNPFEIEVPTSASDPMLYFGIYEVWSYEWKKGLLVHSAFVKEVEEDDSTKK